MLNEWWGRPSTEGRPDYNSRVSTEKGLGLDETNPKRRSQYTCIRKIDNEVKIGWTASVATAPKQQGLYDNVIVRVVI